MLLMLKFQGKAAQMTNVKMSSISKKRERAADDFQLCYLNQTNTGPGIKAKDRMRIFPNGKF